jgi:hypothetical protein
MRRITESEYRRTSPEFKGKWTAAMARYRGDVPKSWIGRRTLIWYVPGKGTSLFTEGVHFVIVKSRKNPGRGKLPVGMRLNPERPIGGYSYKITPRKGRTVKVIIVTHKVRGKPAVLSRINGKLGWMWAQTMNSVVFSNTMQALKFISRNAILRDHYRRGWIHVEIATGIW